MKQRTKWLATAAFALCAGAASAQSGTGTWQFPLLSPLVGKTGTITMPGEAWPPGTPLDGYASEDAVKIVQQFYAAAKSGNLAAATQLICPGDRAAFTGETAADLALYMQMYPGRERVAVIQYPTLDLVFVRLVAPSGFVLRAIEVLPPAADPIVNSFPSPPRRTTSCITQLDEAAAAIRDLLALTMPELRDPTFPNPWPGGIPNN
jgi:hypothetical protein